MTVARPKVVVAAVIESPSQHSRILSGFELSPIVSYNSGHPFNLLAGADINGDNHFTNDRPPGAPRKQRSRPELRIFVRFRIHQRSEALTDPFLRTYEECKN